MPLLHLVVQQQLEHSVLPNLLLWECCHHAGETDAHSEIQVNSSKKDSGFGPVFQKSYFRAGVIAKVESFFGCINRYSGGKNNSLTLKRVSAYCNSSTSNPQRP